MLQLDLSPFPVIRTERLLLRPTTVADADVLYELRRNEDVMRYIDRPRPDSINDILALIQKIQDRFESNDGISWALALPDTDRYIGTISFHEIMKAHFRAEVGYMLHPDFHGKGIMSEALQAVIAHGFNNMGLHSIEAHLDPCNVASARILERNGFVREGLFKENHYWQGRFNDTAIYSLLKPKTV